jgi:hippurate hydrolase
MHYYLSLLLTFLLPSHLYAQNVSQDKILQLIDKEYSDLENLYQHLHSHPELSFAEEKTAVRLAEEVRQIGFEVTENFGGHGVVAVLENGEGPTVLVRADMDALPIKEETGVPFASPVTTTDGSGNEIPVMHACGHDIHMTVWTGTARVLTQLKNSWKGTLVFIAQPAEERSGGAKAMLAEGLFTKFPRPDYGLALHVNATMAAGKVGYCPGYALANVDMVDITVKGKGGHGASPHATIDPIVLASRIVLDLQTIVSREISPLEPAVVTVGSIHGGTKGNVIPAEVKMELTLRSFSDEVHKQLLEKIKRICNGVAMSAGVAEENYPVITVRDEYTPSLYNDPVLAERITNVFKGILGEDNVVQLPPEMIGEDFGRYGRVDPPIPTLMFSLGTIPPSKIEAAQKGSLDLPSLHSSKYIPEAAPSIKTGILTMTSAIMNLLNH